MANPVVTFTMADGKVMKAELYLQAEELVVKSGLIEPTYVEEAPTFVKKYVKNYFVSTVGQVDFSKVYIEK